MTTGALDEPSTSPSTRSAEYDVGGASSSPGGAAAGRLATITIPRPIAIAATVTSTTGDRQAGRGAGLVARRRGARGSMRAWARRSRRLGLGCVGRIENLVN